MTRIKQYGVDKEGLDLLCLDIDSISLTCPSKRTNILIMRRPLHPKSYIKSIGIDNINSSADDIRNLVEYVKTHYRKGIDYEAYSAEVWRDGHLMPSEYMLDSMRIKSVNMLNDQDFNALLKKVEQFSREDDNEPFCGFNIGLALFMPGFLIFIAFVIYFCSSR
jgi:hypothetical protein